MGKIKAKSKGLHKISSIAAHVPDIVVYTTLTKDIPYAEHFHGVLLFADVSGFTALTEKFSLSSKKGYGADELTHTLNSYIGEIVSHILAAGGDILNYAGDAILALWTVERMQLSDVISLAVKCSLNIQDQCGIRETEVGCQLRVKIGISAGKLSKVITGDDVSQYIVVIGRAVDEVRLAEGLAVASTIILSPNAWELCDRDNIVIDPIENERAVKVRYIKREPSFSVEKYICEMGKTVAHDELMRDCVRKTSRLMPNEELEKYLRKYIMKTVLQKIDDDQPLEYLSEMRPATIVFVNLQFKGVESDLEQCFAIHKATISIGVQVRRHHGRCNKVFMFDKGCTFLCLFGLPGDKREDESAHALQAAYGLHELCLKEIKSLRTVSVGVTTGPVFCGVVGHPVRHEYTVIGRKVNLAARLMMHYPGVVSCDSETSYYSKLPSLYFNELPKKAMKGVRNPGTIYQFLARKQQMTVGRAPMSVEREEGYPLLGREKEMKVFSKALKEFVEARTSGDKNYNNIVIYEGPIGYGKSRLLAEVVYRIAKEGIRVISFELAKTDIKQASYTLQTLLAIVMSVEKCKSYAERERVILSKIQDLELRENLCLLNDILLVKFPVSENVSLMDSETKNKEMKNFYMQLFCKAAEEEPCVYVIDQAHFVDRPSWNFLLEACERASVLICMALLSNTSHRGPFPELTQIIEDPRTLYLKLPGLEPPLIAQLACQILGVVRIPSEVELFLVERSHGVPYYCEELLKSLYLSDMIIIEALEEEDEYKDIDILFPAPALVVHRSKPSQVWQDEEGRNGAAGQVSVLKSRKIRPLDKSCFTDRAFVCFIGEAAKFHEIPIPLTLKGMALARLDHLQPAEQMVVKCAAIIGHLFTTQMLTNILLDAAADKLNLSLVTLFKSGTFECGSRPKSFTSKVPKEAERWGVLSCYCNRDDDDDDDYYYYDNQIEVAQRLEVGLASLDGAWQCQVMRFCTALVRETAYELWLNEQKREIHSKCAGYLLKQAHRCPECGIDEFIFGHKAAVGNSIIEINGMLNNQESCERALLTQSYLCLRRGTVMMNQVMPVPEMKEGEHFLSRLDSMVDDKRARVASDRSKRCRCAQVVECVLCPMVRHWMGVGDVSKSFYYLLETAAASAYLSNNLKVCVQVSAIKLNSLKALSYLNEAMIILNNLKAGKPAFETADPKGKVKICKFERACVFSLRGEVLFNTGQITKAEEMFVNALKLLNRRFPTSRCAMSLKYIYEKMKSLCYKSKSFEIPKEKRLAVLHEQICCLSYMWQISCMRGIHQNVLKASLAITMENNSAAVTAEEFKIVFSSIDYFQYSQVTGLEVQCDEYEQMLCETCLELPDSTEGLAVISHFIRTLCIVKLCSGSLEQSIQYGIRAQKISKLMNRPGLDMWVIAVLHTPLVLTNRYRECVQLMQSLEYLGNVTRISTAKGWFYAACFDFLLYSGFAFRPFDECLTFMEESQSDPNLVVDKSLMMNLYSALALWYARLCEWEKACFFYTKAYAASNQAPSTLHSINGVVMFLECNVLLFKKALIEQNQHTRIIYLKTQKLFSEFKKKYGTNKMYTPRVMHLKAYIYVLSGHETLAATILKKALELCEKHGNKREESWMRQNEAVWSGRVKQRGEGWFAATMRMPSWDEAAGVELEELQQYCYPLTGLSVGLRDQASYMSLSPDKADTI